MQKSNKWREVSKRAALVAMIGAISMSARAEALDLEGDAGQGVSGNVAYDISRNSETCEIEVCLGVALESSTDLGVKDISKDVGKRICLTLPPDLGIDDPATVGANVSVPTPKGPADVSVNGFVDVDGATCVVVNVDSSTTRPKTIVHCLPQCVSPGDGLPGDLPLPGHGIVDGTLGRVLGTADALVGRLGLGAPPLP